MPKLQASGAFAQALDDNARALNGAYWKVYAAGTTTQATTYSNALLTIANAWPVIGDAAGRLPDIYVAPGNYRIRVETAGGVMIAESDNNVVYGLDPGEVAVAKFKTPAIWLADETVGYALGGPVSIVVTAGDVIEVGAFRLGITTSGDTADGLIQNANGVKAKVLGQVFDVTAYGAAVDDATDDSAAAQKAIDAVTANGGGILRIPAGVMRAQGLELDGADIRIECDGWIRPMSDVAGAVLAIGKNSTGTTAMENITGYLKIGDPTGATEYANMRGLDLYHCQLADLGVTVRSTVAGFSIIPGAGQYVAYNNFQLGELSFVGDGITIAPTGSGYANSNNFHGGRPRARATGYHIKVTAGEDFQPNHNVFYAPWLEGVGGIFSIDGRSTKIHGARYEPSAASTQGQMEFLSNSANNVVEFAYSDNLFTDARRHINHGGGTRLDDRRFTIAGDLTGYFWAGAIVRLTAGGTTYTTSVSSSTHSGGTTTVILSSAVLSGNPSNILTAKLTNTGIANDISYSVGTSQGVNVSWESKPNTHISMPQSTLYMTPITGDIPAVNLAPQVSSTEMLLATYDFTKQTAGMPASGQFFTNSVRMTAGAVAGDTGDLAMGANTATTIGASGGAAALPANPTGYIRWFIGSTEIRIPYYNAP